MQIVEPFEVLYRNKIGPTSRIHQKKVLVNKLRLLFFLFAHAI